tara:strand:+ start:908 stop:1084 length:177 start_codon:yes stop_codon:yes gene_type:complete
MDRAVFSIFGVTFKKYGPNYVVAASGVVMKIFERIWPTCVTFVEPQVVVGVQYWDFGF